MIYHANWVTLENKRGHAIFFLEGGRLKQRQSQANMGQIVNLVLHVRVKRRGEYGMSEHVCASWGSSTSYLISLIWASGFISVLMKSVNAALMEALIGSWLWKSLSITEHNVTVIFIIWTIINWLTLNCGYS